MATVQEPRTGNRFESFVESQLSRARRRIQAQDVGTAALGLLAGTLAYTLGMVLLDRWLDLSETARQIGLFGYLAAAISYAAIVLTRPLRREVNPYFAARRVERAVPGAKNSVVSWLDLHAEPLPESIKAAVSQKAAADIKKADVDEVVRDGRLAWIGGLAGGLFVTALILFFVIRPNQFLSLLGRTFTPFGSGAIASQTSLNLIQPAGGDLTVPVNSLVDFKVDVLGRVPDPTAADAVRLRFRYNPVDPIWEEIRLDPSLRDPREFSLRMPAGRVQNGFVYQIVGGDAVTPEFRVQVRSSPLIEGFDVGYHFRPYLRFRDQTATNPNIESLRGTQVTLTARTNRTVRRGELTFHGRESQKLPPPILAEAVPDQPASLRFRFVLDEDAKYTIKFWSAEGEDNGEPIPYTIKVLADHPPQVDVTQPAPETLPVNGTIAVEGKAADDFGITKMRLCLRLADVVRPIDLAPKPYRPEKVFKFADDTYPRALEYKDFLPLEQLKTALGAPVTLKPGLVIEYWLEAEDNCDYPKPNVGKSKVYKVTLGDPQEAQDKQAGEKQAAGDKAQHDQKQDQDLNQQNEAKKQAGDKSDQGEPQGDQPKQGDEQNPDPKAQPDANDRAIEKQVQDAREKMDRAREQGNKGEAKGATDQQSGEPRSDPGQPKGDQNQGNQPNTQQNPAGQPNNEKGQGKGDQQSGQPQQQADKGENKPDNPPAAQPDPGAAKTMQPNNQSGNSNSSEPKNPDGGQSNSKQPDQKQPNPNDAGSQQPKNGSQTDAKQPDQKQPNPNDAGSQQPRNGSQTDAKQPDQKQPKSDGSGAPSPKPNDAGNSGQTDNKQSPNAGDKTDQPKGQPNLGEAKPQPQGGQPDAGENKKQPQEGAQPGAAKGNDPANGQKSGAEKSGDPKSAGPPGENPRDNKAGNPDGTPPNKPSDAPDKTKPANGDRPPSDNPKKEPDGNNGPQKQQPGAGAQPGVKNQSGEQPGSGPKKDPNNREPKGQPDPNDPGKQGAGSNQGSGQAGGQAKDPKNHEAPDGTGQGGTPDPGEAKPKNTPAAGQEKGQAKPAGEAGEKNQGQPSGAPTGNGDLTDAPKGGHEQPGAASKVQPKSDGAASNGPLSGNKSNDEPSAQSGLEKLVEDLKSADPQTRQAAENRVKDLAKEMAKQGNGQKPADPQQIKAAEAKAKEMLKQLDKDPAGRQALENALKSAVEQAGKEQLQNLAQDLKSGDAKTRDAAKERAKQLAQGDLKPLADDAKSADPRRQQRAKEAMEQLAKDPQTQQALMDALKGDGKPGDEPNKKSDGQARQDFNGGKPDKAPLTSTPPEAGLAPDPKTAGKTSDLQLERFPKNPSKELLQELGMTEEQYRQFLKAAVELQKKREAEAKNNRQRGAITGTSAANSDVKRVQGGGDKANQLERGGTSLPPEEYRDGYKGFTEDVSKTGGTPKKE
jgi:hypothetical protein